MARLLIVATLVLGVGVGIAVPAGAEHVKSTLQVLAETPKARFNARIQVLLVEQRLNRPEQVSFYPFSLSSREGTWEVDQQIRRVGELIRRQQRE